MNVVVFLGAKFGMSCGDVNTEYFSKSGRSPKSDNGLEIISTLKHDNFGYLWQFQKNGSCSHADGSIFPMSSR